MYLLTVILFVAIVLSVTVLSGGAILYIDFPSILMILLLTAAMVMASGLSKALGRAFRIMSGKYEVTDRAQLSDSLEAVNLTILMLLFSGVFGTLTGIIATFAYAKDTVLQNISVSLLTLFYGMMGAMFLLPVRAKIKSLLAKQALKWKEDHEKIID